MDIETELFIKAYRSFLRAQGEMTIDQFTALYKQMQPGLHMKASSKEIDVPAFVYSFLRLPKEIKSVKKIILAQTADIFHREGYAIEGWKEVSAPARRRKMYFDGDDTLAMVINSVTDIDDIVCLLTAFQIEWNKMIALAAGREVNRDTLSLTDEGWHKLVTIWKEDVSEYKNEIQYKTQQYSIRLLKGSYVEYLKAAQRWFENICAVTRYKDLRSRPVYFVSSNTHSLVNMITGFVTTYESELVDYLQEEGETKLLEYWYGIQSGKNHGSKENLLWYVLKRYERKNPDIRKKRIAYEQRLGIDYIEARHFLDINAQIINIKDLAGSGLAEKLHMDTAPLASSDAILLNIDYPLGFGAYMVLSTLMRNINTIKGMYILGKASFLHANLGDIGLPTLVYDTYSKNKYIFRNAFTRDYFREFSNNVLIDQKAVTTRGTLLQPESVVKQYFIEDYSLIEMENGPYLNALFQTLNYERYPENETINITSSIDIGIIHYASDTPFTKAVTLGTRNLGYEGVDATYTSSLAILKRIVEKECQNGE